MINLDNIFRSYRSIRHIFRCHQKIVYGELIKLLLQSIIFKAVYVEHNGLRSLVPVKSLIGLDSVLTLHDNGVQCRFDGIDLIATINGFEPVPSTFEYLAKNIHDNRLTDRIVSFPYGLSDKNDNFEVSVKPYASACAQTIHKSQSKRKGLDIERVDIRNAIEVFTSLKLQHISLLKLDCEGCEYQVLSEQFLSMFKPQNIALEFHSGSQNIERLLLRHGNKLLKQPKTDNVGMIYAKLEN